MSGNPKEEVGRPRHGSFLWARCPMRPFQERSPCQCPNPTQSCVQHLTASKNVITTRAIASATWIIVARRVGAAAPGTTEAGTRGTARTGRRAAARACRAATRTGEPPQLAQEPAAQKTGIIAPGKVSERSSVHSGMVRYRAPTSPPASRRSLLEYIARSTPSRTSDMLWQPWIGITPKLTDTRMT